MNKLILVVSIFFILFLNSCKEKSNKKILDINKINKPVEKVKKDILVITEIDTLKPFFELYNQKMVDLKINEITQNIESPFIARFPHKKIVNLTLSSSNSKTNHTELVYADTNERKNAFYNFLDCYGENCQSISVNDKVIFEKEFFMLISTEKSIHIIKSNKNQNPNSWIYLSNLSSKKITTLIIQNKNQVAKWYKYESNKLIEIL